MAGLPPPGSTPYRGTEPPLSTHALVDDRALGRTALAPGPSGSGLVTPGELAGLRLDADMVVLSACRTAGGVVVDGEGIQRLTAALLAAGARSVVATAGAWATGARSGLWSGSTRSWRAGSR
jgi:CHAT domain-containing protein